LSISSAIRWTGASGALIYAALLSAITKDFASGTRPLAEYLAHCEARLRRDDLAAETLRGYRKILDGVWRPAPGSVCVTT
jgi:hypothetical protein